MAQETNAGAHTHAWSPTTAATGDVVRWSRTIIPTLREAPAEATTPSHRLLLRAGYIRQVAAGVYDYLPLAWRSLTKVSRIVREEMDAAGGCEMLMPALAPMELFEETGRAEDYGDDLFRLKDRHGRPTALGPTHEEVITAFLRDAVTSYRQLPLILYQVQSKFRDEPRPRAGLLRCREFIMKDAYSFHISLDGPGGLNEAYDAMYRAYTNVFTRCGLDFTVVEAESGPIGGSASHEFMVNCETGEDTILRCPVSGYAANVEKCEIGERPWSFEGVPSAELRRVHTPGMPGIDAVADHLGVKPSGMLKTIVLANKWFSSAAATAATQHRKVIAESGPTAHGGHFTSPEQAPRVKWVLAVVRGDHEVNLGKVKAAVGFPVEVADPLEAARAGFAIGYVSPRAIKQDNLEQGARTLVVVDPDAAQGGSEWATGADEHDHHVTGFSWRREMGDSLDQTGYVKVADLRNAQVGDPSPRAPGATLVAQRGIETGHIFKLGTKYSDAMGFAVMDESQSRRSVIMGCYGIGVSRTMAACVEMSHDENGIIWPAAIAPYHVLIVLMKPDDPAHAEAADRLASELAAAGLDVLIDDRSERPGVKFKDADLIGIPVRLTIGEKALAAGGVELKARRDPGKGEVVPTGEVRERCLGALRG